MADKKNFEINDDELDQVVGGAICFNMGSVEKSGFAMADSFVEGNGLYGVNSSINVYPSVTQSIDPNDQFIAQSNTADLHIQHMELMS